MLQLLASLTVLAGLLMICAMPLVLVIQFLNYFLRGRLWTAGLSISLTGAAAFLLGGTISWFALSPGWQLSFLTTVAAAVDSETYGHPVEHAAENLLVAVLFFALIGSVVAGSATALKLRRR